MTIAAAAGAVVIDSGDGTGNTTPPADDFGFENVGVTNTNLSGVYLGEGWVLTANHVGARPITLNGVEYQPVAGSGVRLSNPSGPPPDLYVYRINGFPALPPLTLATSPPSIGELVHCTGHGWTRAPTTTTWNATWEEQPPPVYTGYKYQSPRTRRWGTNLAASKPPEFPTILDTEYFLSLFDEVGGTAHELQGVTGDSGGGCFAKRDGVWELVGVMYAILIYPDQPSLTAVYGNATVAADVAFYREEIEDLTPPLGAVPALPPLGVAALAAMLVLAARRGYAARSPTRR